MLGISITSSLDELSSRFMDGSPYRHVCIDGFFDDQVVQQILRDFPAFDRTGKNNEFGVVGPKAVHETLSEVSPFYQQLSTYFASEEFRQVISRLSGIPDLHWGGESMYGGGTHENVNGAELDPHVDFNYNDRTAEHRRLNLLIYLNEDWGDDWGGEFELHSDPRDPANDKVKSYAPIFNRAVLMETNVTMPYLCRSEKN